MKIAFVINDISTETPGYTTTRLALAAHQRGHEIAVVPQDRFQYQPDGTIAAQAHRAPGKAYRSRDKFLADLQDSANDELVTLSDFDAVLLRADPSDDALDKPWANTASFAFGRLLAAQGVLVLNDPSSLAQALSKTYFQEFPEVVRPRTIISRDEAEITAFVEAEGGKAVLKPLQGSGGSGVFLVTEKESPNLNQIIEAIGRDGYVVAQEYLPAASDGDVRMWLMNGRPLEVNGQYAAFRRHNESDDMRSNVSAGGHVKPAEITEEMLKLAEAVRPKLIADGLFLVGLDIVGDKLMEVNVFTPGGLGVAETLYKEDFVGAVIDELLRKTELHQHYRGQMDNTTFATI